MHLNNVPLLCCLFLAASLTTPGTSFAHGGAKGIVKERMDSMEVMGKAMKYVSGMVRGKVSFDMKTVDNAAITVVQHGRQIPNLFPEGSDRGFTEASPQIWKDFSGFQNSVDEMISAAQALSDAAHTNNPKAVETAHRKLGRTCSSCHKQYREKKSASQHHPSLWSKVAQLISGIFGR